MRYTESNEVTQIMQSTTGNQPLRIMSHKVEFYREYIIDVLQQSRVRRL